MEKLIFKGEKGENISLYVLETTRLQGVDYLLTCDTEAGDGDCYIWKEIPSQSSEEAVYEPVADDALLENLMGIFAELLEDVDLVI